MTAPVSETATEDVNLRASSQETSFPGSQKAAPRQRSFGYFHALLVFRPWRNPDLDSLGGLVSVGLSHYAGPAVASNGTDFMVVGVNAHRVTASGQVLDPAGITLGGSTGQHEMKDVTWTGQEWAVAMLTDTPSQPSQTLVQRVSSGGSLIDVEPIVVEADLDRIQAPLALAGSGTGEAVIAYPYWVNFDPDLHATLLRDDGSVAAPVELAFGLSRQVYVEVVDGPGNQNLAQRWVTPRSRPGSSPLATTVRSPRVRTVLSPLATIGCQRLFRCRPDSILGRPGQQLRKRVLRRARVKRHQYVDRAVG